MATRFFATESVTEGHPDKVCDRISDSVLDALLRNDENARCACETAVTTQHVLVMGEITAKGSIDVEKTVRDAVRDIGYTKKEYGFDCDNLKILNLIHTQSPDIAMGVDESLEAKEGAGDGLTSARETREWFSATLAERRKTLCPSVIQSRRTFQRS